MLKERIVLYLKGVCMGAADVVPGVSGGTIAFITGIYEELVNSLKSIDPAALSILLKGNVLSFWKKINAGFLLVLFLGIGTSIVSLARVIDYLLRHYPILLWGFFFGLIVASALMVARKVAKWTAGSVAAISIGIAGAFLITELTPAATPETPLFTFCAGMIAICAMILPGISGSFLLLMMKQYERIIGAVKSFDIEIILTFGSGAAIGLVLFSNVLSWLFRKYHDLTVALLTGIMFGSLNQVWPWKRVEETWVNSHGDTVPLIQSNVLPGHYEGEAYLWQTLALAGIGFLLILAMENRSKPKSA